MGLLSRGRAHRDEAKALALLRAGRVRRSRALLRLLARRSRRALLDWARFHQAVALFWEGAFDDAREYAVRAVASGNSELGVLSIVLEVECLLFENRIAEARALFDTHSVALTSHPGYEDVVPSGHLLAAMLRFHEGDIEGSLTELEVAAEIGANGRTPVTRVIAFYLGAIAHKQGRASDARRYLGETIECGGELFVSTWAADTHGELFPGEPIPSSAVGGGRPSRARWRGGTLRNLSRGFGILCFRPSALAGASYTFDQTMALLVVNLLCAGLVRCVDFTRGATFIEYTAIALAGALVPFMVVAWISMRGARKSSAAINVAGAFYSALPTLLVLDFAAMRTLRPGLAHVCGGLLAIWTLAVVLVIVVRVARGGPVRALVAGALFIACCVVPMSRVHGHPLWLNLQPRASLEDSDERELLSFVFAQADQVHAAEAALAAERPGVPDLYFVGFAGWGAQDVFLNEVTAARALFDERFDTRGRSLTLANAPSTRRKLPMATKLNLGHVLKAVGERMNPEEDVLFLFLTSHGSSAGLGLESSDHPQMTSEESISPAEVRSLLEETRIKWRVIVVSGCESGVFVAALQDDQTLIATASASDRKSFGCESGREFTEYGRALFAEQLRRDRSFETALEKANAVVAERENERGLTASLPQLSVGSAIRAKLRSLEDRVRDPEGSVKP